MKNKIKIISIGLVITLLVTSVALPVYALTRMYGLQQVMDEVESGRDFNVVEIVPDSGDASFGYLVKNSEPMFDGKLLVNEGNMEQRAEKVRLLYQPLIDKGIIEDSVN